MQNKENLNSRSRRSLQKINYSEQDLENRMYAESFEKNERRQKKLKSNSSLNETNFDFDASKKVDAKSNVNLSSTNQELVVYDGKACNSLILNNDSIVANKSIIETRLRSMNKVPILFIKGKDNDNDDEITDANDIEKDNDVDNDGDNNDSIHTTSLENAENQKKAKFDEINSKFFDYHKELCLRKKEDESQLVTENDLYGNDDTQEDVDRVNYVSNIYNHFYSEAIKTEAKRSDERKKLYDNANKNGIVIRKKYEIRTQEVIDHLKSLKKTNEEKRPSKRPDLVAMSKMKEQKLCILNEKAIGRIKGIKPGFQCIGRCHLIVLGLHSHWLNGIDYITKEKSTYGMSVCSAVCLSGGYEDDADSLDYVEYCGQGGNDLLSNSKQYKDQKLTLGNLALANSLKTQNLIRLIRGHRYKGSFDLKLFTFDGMYRVESFREVIGKEGFKVYKFMLRRVENQPLLTSEQVFFVRSKKTINDVQGIITKDLSNGLEKFPIIVTNLVDNETVPIFNYTTTIIYPPEILSNLDIPKGCNCKDGCSILKNCTCTFLNGGTFPYVQHKKGSRLIMSKGITVECGPHCGCPPTCFNRVAQKGTALPLEVFKTHQKGWGVRAWEMIPAGTPVCSYVGKIHHEHELNHLPSDMYVISIDTVHTARHGSRSRDAKFNDVKHLIKKKQRKNDDDAESEYLYPYAIDGNEYGNVSRFINHSCDPNLFLQATLWNHHDPDLAQLVLVAARNIPSMEELTYDYNYQLNSVADKNGKIKELACHCGSIGCRKRLY